jgi:hypothetical protein
LLESATAGMVPPGTLASMKSISRVVVSCLLGLSSGAACAKSGRQGESTAAVPPEGTLPASRGASSPLSAPLASSEPAAASNPPPSVPAAGASSAGGAPSAASGGAPSAAEPSLLDAAGKPLPQTEDEPRIDTPAFLRRMERLAHAIASDDPELAISTFFPVIAYAEVKAIARPERDHERRLLAAFRRNVHEYHRSLGKRAAGARFAGVEVPEAAARWMKPGSEGNRLGYFRVLRSKLRLALADGGERTFEITSMISWRGEWYVVHLHGFE